MVEITIALIKGLIVPKIEAFGGHPVGGLPRTTGLSTCKILYDHEVRGTDPGQDESRLSASGN
ncbi:hypothetical protein A8M60_02975 [Nocardia farcinica]|nr:hypothetical protein A8M60_02975 [Nocardia farcinica]